jgi:hypothetical protein
MPWSTREFREIRLREGPSLLKESTELHFRVSGELVISFKIKERNLQFCLLFIRGNLLFKTSMHSRHCVITLAISPGEGIPALNLILIYEGHLRSLFIRYRTSRTVSNMHTAIIRQCLDNIDCKLLQ